MDDERRELANRLFAVATEMLKDAITIAIAGQSQKLDQSQLLANGRSLQAMVREIGLPRAE